MGRVLVELLKVNTISLYAGESLSWDKSQLMYSNSVAPSFGPNTVEGFLPQGYGN
jgi:hypothetical protein